MTSRRTRSSFFFRSRRSSWLVASSTSSTTRKPFSLLARRNRRPKRSRSVGAASLCLRTPNRWLFALSVATRPTLPAPRRQEFTREVSLIQKLESKLSAELSASFATGSFLFVKWFQRLQIRSKLRTFLCLQSQKPSSRPRESWRKWWKSRKRRNRRLKCKSRSWGKTLSSTTRTARSCKRRSIRRPSRMKNWTRSVKSWNNR